MKKSTKFYAVSVAAVAVSLILGVTFVATNHLFTGLATSLILGAVAVLFFFSSNATAAREKMA